MDTCFWRLVMRRRQRAGKRRQPLRTLQFQKTERQTSACKSKPAQNWRRFDTATGTWHSQRRAFRLGSAVGNTAFVATARSIGQFAFLSRLDKADWGAQRRTCVLARVIAVYKRLWVSNGESGSDGRKIAHRLNSLPWLLWIVKAHADSCEGIWASAMGPR